MPVEILTSYGPLSFGVVVTLVLWKVVVTPSLSVLKSVVDGLKDVQETQKVILNTLVELRDGHEKWYEKERKEALCRTEKRSA
jgi:hypothetical protein